VGLDSLYRLLNWQALIEKKKEASRQHQGSRNGKLFELQLHRTTLKNTNNFTIPRIFSTNHWCIIEPL